MAEPCFFAFTKIFYELKGRPHPIFTACSRHTQLQPRLKVYCNRAMQGRRMR